MSVAISITATLTVSQGDFFKTTTLQLKCLSVLSEISNHIF